MRVVLPVMDTSVTCPVECIANYVRSAWWRHAMNTFSALLPLCEGNLSLTVDFHSKRPIMRICCFLSVSMNKLLNRQSICRWFQTLWRPCDASLTHCGLITPYGDIDLGQHWLRLDGTKPLPEPILTNHQCGPVTIIWGQYHKRFFSHQLLI